MLMAVLYRMGPEVLHDMMVTTTSKTDMTIATNTANDMKSAPRATHTMEPHQRKNRDLTNSKISHHGRVMVNMKNQIKTTAMALTTIKDNGYHGEEHDGRYDDDECAYDYNDDKHYVLIIVSRFMK